MRLTAKERETAELYAAGLTPRQIGKRLGTSSATVRGRMYRAARKRGIHQPWRAGQILVAREILAPYRAEKAKRVERTNADA